MVRVPHPSVSLWQSAVREVASDRIANGDVTAAAVRQHLAVTGADQHAEHRDRAAGELGGLRAVVAALRTTRAYSERDPGFLFDCMQRYLRWYWLGHRPVYRDWRVAGNGDLNFGVVERRLPSRVRIGLLADWGTGLGDARALLDALLTLNPEVLVHLGDIYYAGTPRETERHFAAVLSTAFQRVGRRIPVYSIPGNHDYYSGGRGFYGLIDRLNEGPARQAASYFCLRSEDGGWQLVGVDTGFNDRVPSHHFEPSAIGPGLQESEELWLRHKLDTFGGRTILLSHHPVFSAHERINGARSGAPEPNFNTALHRSAEPYLDRVPLWLWGHEHSLGIYEEGVHGLARGRLIGCSAFETATGDDPYEVKFPGAPYRQPLVRLGVDHGWYNHGFAIIDLDGPAATVGYYQFPSWAGDVAPPTPAPSLLFQEEL